MLAQAPTPAADPAADAAERQKTADEWKEKLDNQKKKIDSLNHEVDLDQRELRLRAAAIYADPGTRCATVQWNKDDTQYQSDLGSQAERTGGRPPGT